MARALLGHVGSPNEHVLAHEITRLRRRVAELEAQVAALQAERVGLTDDDFDAALGTLGLHTLAETAQPALA